MIQIRHRDTGAVLFESEATTLRLVVEAAVKAGACLAGACLADADLAGADLAGACLADANLAGACLADADLADANLAGADLADADLADADLAGACLADADLAGARNVPSPDVAPTERPAGGEHRKRSPAERAADYRARHPEVPVVEHLDRRILEAISAPGCALDMSTWHSCETTHCRAGWAIHLAGEKGYALEKALDSSERAGRAIYRASTGRVPHFFASDERALADIKRRAEEDANARPRAGEGDE